MRYLALALVTTSLFAQGRTWVVDAANGAGANFTDLAPAVAAASTGDTILVRRGNYLGFTTGKGLRIAGIGAQVRDVVITNPYRVSGPVIHLTTSAGTEFTLSRVALRYWGPSSGVFCDACAGPVFVQDCAIEGAPFPLPKQELPEGIGLHVRRCALVTVVDTRIASRPAVEVVSSTLVLGNCQLVGASAYTRFVGYTAGEVALRGQDARLEVTQTRMQGGSCAFAACQGRVLPAMTLTVGELRLAGSNVTLTAGDGQPGAPAIEAGGAVVLRDPRVILIPTGGAPPISNAFRDTVRRLGAAFADGGRPGSTLSITVHGRAGDTAVLALDAARLPTSTPLGAVYFDPTRAVFLGPLPLPANELLDVRLPVPVHPALSRAVVGLQPVIYDRTANALDLVSPAFRVLE